MTFPYGLSSHDARDKPQRGAYAPSTGMFTGMFTEMGAR